MRTVKNTAEAESGKCRRIFCKIGVAYCVDCASGDDSNNGTSADSAWKSLEKASEKVYSAGDKMLFKSGETFVGAFNAKGSGTAENPITISSYGGEEKPLFFSNGTHA